MFKGDWNSTNKFSIDEYTKSKFLKGSSFHEQEKIVWRKWFINFYMGFSKTGGGCWITQDVFVNDA